MDYWPSSRRAFRIPCINELLFASMDRETLFAVRFVSHQWCYSASKELQKTTKIVFKLPDYKIKYTSTPHRTLYLYRWPEIVQSRPIQDLTALLSNSSSHAIQFPCTTFVFHDAYEIYFHAAKFLYTVGPFIKKLVLISTKNNSKNVIYFLDLKRILVFLAPNLEHLVLKNDVEFGLPPWTKELKTVCKSYGITYTLTSENSSTLSLNLKYLKMTGKLPQNILWEILRFSPKLTELDIWNGASLHLIVQPDNRLYLLKRLHINLSSDTLDSLEILGNQHNGQLTPVTLSFVNVLPPLKQPDEARAVAIVTKIIDGLSPSLETLLWDQVACLQNFRFPTIMVKVHTVRFCWNLDIWYRSVEIFPVGVHLGKTFPNLKKLQVLNACHLPLPSICLASKFFADTEPVLSVTELDLGGLVYHESFRAMFPNAEFVHREVDEQGFAIAGHRFY